MQVSGSANLKDIATAAGLSLATVSKILRGKYKGNTPKGRERVERVTGLAAKHGYVANAAARRLQGGAHRTVLVVVPVDDLGHPGIFPTEYLFGINQALRAAGYGLLLHTSQRGPDAAAGLPAERQYDGALIIDGVAGAIERLRAGNIPVGVLNAPAVAGCPSFQRDERAAGFDVVQGLAGLGYRRIVTVGEIAGGHASYPQRLQGMRESAAALGLACESLPDPWWLGTMPDTLPRVRLTPGTVLVAMDAHSALHVQRIRGLEVPLACCDDSHVLYELQRDLTRVTYDRLSLGRLAAEGLLRRLQDPAARWRSVTVKGHLILGKTTPVFSG